MLMHTFDNIIYAKKTFFCQITFFPEKPICAGPTRCLNLEM